MNVLQVNKFYYPKVGGIEQVVQAIAEGLPEQYSTRVLAAQPRGVGRREQHNGIPVTKASSLGVLLSVPIAPTFPLRLRTAIKDVDVVHHHLPNPLSTVSHLIAAPSNLSVVATYHSDIVRQRNAFRAYRPILDQFLRQIDRIIVTSKRLLDHSEVLEPYQDKCDIVPLSVDLEAIDARNTQPLNFGADNPVILFVGRLNYYKGVEYLIDAMEDIDGTLLIAGDGDRRSALEQRVRDRDIVDRVKFLGFVDDEQLARAYDTADIFVLPSVETSEAFGIAQLEAMARSVPVVNTSLPTGVPWVSIDGETGLTVPPRDASALADAINTLLDDEELRQRFGKQARRRVKNNFTRDEMIERIQEIYEKAE